MKKPLKQQLKQLYKICFPEDSEKYIDFFLENKWDGENCMTVFDGGTMVNMLFLVKKKICVRGTVFDIPYMVAGGTLPQYRGRGIFSKVMLEAMENFQSQGDKPLTGLMPSAHAFYIRHSFVTHAFIKEKTLKKGKLPLKEIGVEQIPQMKKIYEKFMAYKSGWFCRDDAAWELRLKEIFLEGGKAYGLFESGVLKGYVFTFDDEEIEEYCAAEEKLIEKFNTPFESCSVNVNGGEGGEELNMIRICDNKALLSGVNYPKEINEKITLEVVDKFHTKNSGKLMLSVNNGSGKVTGFDGEAEFVLTIEQFTKLVMGCYKAGEFEAKLQEILPPILNCPLEMF